MTLAMAQPNHEEKRQAKRSRAHRSGGYRCRDLGKISLKYSRMNLQPEKGTAGACCCASRDSWQDKGVRQGSRNLKGPRWPLCEDEGKNGSPHRLNYGRATAIAK